MAITAELADGRTLEFPDGTDPSIVQRTVKNMVGGSTPTAAPKPPRAITKDNPNAIDDFLIGKLAAAPGLGNAPDIQGSIPGRVIQGLADPMLGALQLGAHYSTGALIPGATNAIDDKIRQINERTEALRGGKEAGIDWARLAGNVASPIGIAAAAKVPLAATRMGKIGQGAALGAAGGATAPVTTEGDFNEEKATQIGAGAAMGAAIPAVAPLVTEPLKAGYRALAEPLVDSAAIKGRAFLEAAGDKADDIIKSLRANKAIVPGTKPIAGEVAADAGSAEFSALQAQARDINPTAYAGREGENNAARLASLRTVGQDEPALKMAEVQRKAVTDPMYAAATAKGGLVDTMPIKAQVDNLIANKPGNTELQAELAKVRKGLLYANGELRTDAGQVSSVIDGLKTAIAKEDNKFIAGTLRSLQKDLEKALPGYEAAQSKFRDMSKPINQMQVGQYLEQKLVPALADDAKQRSGVYAQALRDAPGTIKRATGAPRYEELTQVLDKNQMAVVNGIRDDLARGAKFEDLAKKGAKAAPDISKAGGDARITGMFDRTVTIANAIISRLEGKVNKRLASEIAVEMMNPVGVGESLAKAKARADANKAFATMVAKRIQQATPGTINATQRN